MRLAPSRPSLSSFALTARLALGLSLACALPTGVAAASDGAAALHAGLSDRYVDALAHGQPLNPWAEAPILASFVRAFEATGDAKFLDRLVRHGRALLAHTDEALHKKDAFTKATVPAWSTLKYSCDKPHAWLVHMAIVAAPLVELHRVVREHRALAGKYQIDADRFVRWAERALAAYTRLWSNDRDGGFYRLPKGLGACARYAATAGKAQPFNMMLAAGTLHVRLHESTRQPVHLERARRLARFFARHVHSSGGAVVWPYAVTRSTMEDTSHATLDVQFAVEANRDRIVLGDAFLRGLAHAFVVKIAKRGRDGHYSLATHVQGHVDPKRDYSRACSGWLGLARFDRKVHDVCKDVLRPGGPYASAEGTAALLRFEKLGSLR